jgi:hypothetical protein
VCDATKAGGGTNIDTKNIIINPAIPCNFAEFFKIEKLKI